MMALFSPLSGRKAQHMERLAEVPALQNVSFKVEPGEIVGIIGKNGAGKSTLLKLLSRVSPPTEGSIRLRGRVGSLLEVGTGFHPELTGRQNIFLNGTLLGMRRLEIQDRFDEIVEFSEVKAFLDLPVKFYSSGMYMRLAFAVAAHLEPEVLIIDEILAVGDAAFQQKCLKKVKERGGLGGTIIFVSHNLDVVSSLCTRAIYLDRGEVVADGAVGPVINQYLQTIDFARDLHRWDGEEGDDSLKLIRTELIAPPNAQGLDTSMPLTFQFEFRITRPLAGLIFNLTLWSSTDRMLGYSLYDDLQTGPPPVHQPGHYVYEVTIPPNTLSTGSFTMRPQVAIAHRKVITEEAGHLRFSLMNLNGIGRRFPNDMENLFRPAWNWKCSEVQYPSNVIDLTTRKTGT